MCPKIKKKNEQVQVWNDVQCGWIIIVERKTVKPLFCMKVKRSSKNSFLFGSLSSSYSCERKGVRSKTIFSSMLPTEDKSQKSIKQCFCLNSLHFWMQNLKYGRIRLLFHSSWPLYHFPIISLKSLVKWTDVISKSSPWQSLGRLLLFLCYCRPHQPSWRYHSAKEEKSSTHKFIKDTKGDVRFFFLMFDLIDWLTIDW